MYFLKFLVLLMCVKSVILYQFDLSKVQLNSNDNPRPKVNYLSHENFVHLDDYYDQWIDIKNLEDKNNDQHAIADQDCTNCKKDPPLNTDEPASKSHRSISINNKHTFKPFADSKLYTAKTSKLFEDSDPFKEITYYMNDYIPGNDMLKYDPYPDPWSGADAKILSKPLKGVVARELNSRGKQRYHLETRNKHRENQDFILSNSQEPDAMKYKIWNALKNIRSWIHN